MFSLGLSPIISFGIGNDVFVNPSSLDSPEKAFFQGVYLGRRCSVFFHTNIKIRTIEPEPYGASKKTIRYVRNLQTVIQINGNLKITKTKNELKSILDEYGIHSKGIKSRDLSDPAYLHKIGLQLDDIGGK